MKSTEAFSSLRAAGMTKLNGPAPEVRVYQSLASRPEDVVIPPGYILDESTAPRRVEHTAAAGQPNRLTEVSLTSGLTADEAYELDLWRASIAEGKIQ